MLAAPPPAVFEPQVIDSAISIGYGLAIGDVDGDGKPDILLADAREIVWYQNPSWKKHVLARELTKLDHVCLDAADLDGDGKVEVAVGAQWNPGETNNLKLSGAVFFLKRPEKADADTLWTPVALPHEPTVHRMRWVKNSQGKHALVVLPLHGRGNTNGAGANGTKVLSYLPPAEPAKWSEAGEWKITPLDASMHVTHNLDVQPDGDGQMMAIGGKEGALLARPVGGGGWEPASLPLLETPSSVPFGGVGEIRLFPGTRHRLATIEPFHGPNVCTWTWEDKQRGWHREVVDESLASGHALAVGDMNSDQLPDIIAGWREPDSGGKFGIRLYTATGDAAQPWSPSWLAGENSMACEDLKLADLDGDGKPEVIASGRSTRNVVIYHNRTTAKK
ncbi:MAG: hypothetical protein EOP86_21040 [Verrucomicrobiaceae bacterium]|nr:MAG: hypothetical protein EOP86_21040 [Verrucomicrobiaceae bacterium]